MNVEALLYQLANYLAPRQLWCSDLLAPENLRYLEVEDDLFSITIEYSPHRQVVRVISTLTGMAVYAAHGSDYTIEECIQAMRRHASDIQAIISSSRLPGVQGQDDR